MGTVYSSSVTRMEGSEGEHPESGSSSATAPALTPVPPQSQSPSGSATAVSKSNDNRADGNTVANTADPPASPSFSFPWSSWDVRPAALYALILSNSPRLIGWDDEKFRRLAREAYEEGRQERMRQLEATRGVDVQAHAEIDAADVSDLPHELSEEEELARLTQLGPDERERDVMSEIGRGLLGIAADTVTDLLMKTDIDVSDGGDDSGIAPLAEKAVGSTELASVPRPEVQAAERDELGTVAEADVVEDALAANTGNEAYSPPPPPKEKTLRDSELYNYALNSLRWQRDNYIVGPSYAEARKKQRRLEERTKREGFGDEVAVARPGALTVYDTAFSLVPEVSASLLRSHMTYSTAAGTPSLGQAQLASLAISLLPAPITTNALRPTVLWLPSLGGPLDLPVSRAVTNLIPLSQSNLDGVVKESVVWVLRDEHWRNTAKFGAGGYVTGMERDNK